MFVVRRTTTCKQREQEAESTQAVLYLPSLLRPHLESGKKEKRKLIVDLSLVLPR